LSKKRTLKEIVVRNLIDIKRKASKIRNRSKPRLSFTSLLISLKVNEAILEAKEEKSEEDLEESGEDEPEEETINGGYGTVIKHYGTTFDVEYVNYDRIWDHVGSFKSQSMYEKPVEGNSSQSWSKSTGTLVDNEVIEKAERHFKYFVQGEVMGDIGYVPPVGANVDSKDWEKYRIMTQMSIYRPLLALFRAVV
jgi:hypothetical protein